MLPAPGYDDVLMRLPVWNVRTMCGLRWTAMAGHDAELAVLIARAGVPTRPGDGGAAYVCPVCAARVMHGRSAARGWG